MFRNLFLATLVLMLFGLSGCITIPGINSGSVEVGNEAVNVRVAFNEDDKDRIRRYYGQNRKGKKSKKMPPGLAKKQKLPPGLQKHIEKNGVLPPGLRGRSLPSDLDRELSPLPRGYVRLKVGGDVVLMDNRTNVVFDIILGVDN
ncbi:MAG: RcnB family protein [Planctomycetes bacterium]|nr:RcnB family protein [Planctomycetota bacterium]